MKIPGSYLGRFGLAGLTIAGLIFLGWLINTFGPAWGINTPKEQLFAFLLITLLVIFVRFLPALHHSAQERLYRHKAQLANVLPADDKRLAPVAPLNVTVSDIKDMMRHLYGRLWVSKIRILLVVGSVSDVQRLVPGLSQECWQEDQGTLLLWGGELSGDIDTAWLSALRKLRRRPIDGVVWVTSAFDTPANDDSFSHDNVMSQESMNTFAHVFYNLYDALGWRLPLYIWSLHSQTVDQTGYVTQPIGCLLPPDCSSENLSTQLSSLSASLMTHGVQHICEVPRHMFLLSLADRLIRKSETIAGPLAVLLNAWRPLPLAGLLFSMPSLGAARSMRHHWCKDNRWDVLPESVRSLPAGLRPRKPGPDWRRVMAASLALLMTLWGVWMLVSYTSNRNMISHAQEQASLTVQQNQPLAARLSSLSELQKTLERLQYRSEHRVPWYNRAGLSHNNELLAALWPRYRDSALPLLRDAAATQLQQQLTAFEQLPPDSPQRETRAKASYDQLKLYLMLARPERMDAAWFGPTMLRAWPQRDGVSDGVWQGSAPSLLSFYGANLAAHPQWRLPADEEMINQVRSLLIRLMGMRNSESSLYQKMLSQVEHLYVDMRLEDMTGDTDASRLFTDAEVVPGMFTRQAWEQAIQPAIENVVKERRDEIDWVLTDSKQAPQGDGSPEALKKQLTERYFADFGGAWLGFLNALRWQQAATLSDAIDQLTLMADVRQSPLVALMNTLNIQGRTGQTGEAISDSLVKSAKNLLSNENSDAIDQSAGPHGPLDATFGPVLALMDKNHAGEQAQSLQAYLSRVTQVRLRLQQVTNAADPQAMTQTLAQTVFQGKAIDLTETRDYGSLIAAGLGQEWNGFGRTVFVQPMEEAWQQVLAPAADSLNVQWQQAVVSDWNEAFGGRYPFNNSDSDVSLPLLAKYLNADSGRIAQFLQTRLKGVLHREGSHWVSDSVNAQGLTFNPAFLTAINTLSNISDVAFTEGNAGMSFELRPGTADGVMQTDMIIDHQKLNYVNQMPQWKRFTWPADTDAPGATLSWISTQAGTRQYADMPGAWGWIRLLDEASVAPYPGIDSSYSLRWKAQDGRYLNYTLRTVAGEGPLVLLKLRHFRLPETIFSVDASQASSEMEDRKEAD
ncbi:TPA: type VI secretion protein VasK [Cronobacter turicensis]|nr:type VI secretion protein VasK [Cronobacter turicensis]